MPVVTNAFQRKRLTMALAMLSKLACDERDFETASSILSLTEKFVSNSLVPAGEKRSMIESMVEGYERLWMRRHDAATPKRVDVEELC